MLRSLIEKLCLGAGMKYGEVFHIAALFIDPVWRIDGFSVFRFVMELWCCGFSLKFFGSQKGRTVTSLSCSLLPALSQRPTV